MSRDDILRFAYTSKITNPDDGQIKFGQPTAKCLEQFAALVAEAEREACAKVCEEGMFLEGFGAKTEEPMDKRIGKAIANAIRARGDG